MADCGKSVDFYRSHVKFFVADSGREDRFVLDFLSACHNNLVGLDLPPITHDREMWSSLLLAMPFPSLRLLVVSSDVFSYDSGCIFRAPIFQNLTQLDIRFTLSSSTFAAQLTDFHNASQHRKRFSWDGLQSLENLNHLHIEATLALKIRDHDKLRPIVSDILSHLPSSLVYVSISLSARLLKRVAQLENHQRQFYEELISGIIDTRFAISYMSEEDGSSQEEEFFKANFSEYLLPRMQEDPVPFMHGFTTDFWERLEDIMGRRNRELKAGIVTSEIHVQSLE
ncbi:hypothetical protein AGABI1DRAFT_126144 [Agaricus bisporus var. burnettii JB137-S8]|uniref:Uncharacterized protein n=1 Tax=Agaricus bisporus var. burnettii (strain JB137-S8 / ATCC MYA-4627 / FGSC 10392) TaxID=597362 RepID=K5XF02_AGABU|nr:uncharacterized protein AGABI1DRAFT_126144 [Agaricus bisporus var. burnettii JB137-S8]EKM81787.1 hypothetical protein AGABI1DRAFT_126144 [Agaricus bisporus var. burnettii JB137-S8]